MMELAGSILILLGAVFLFSAGLGMFRMPDTFTRIQAGTKASTLGNMLVLLGLAVIHPDWSLKLVILIYFVLMTNPISSHAIARVAYAARMPMAGPAREDDTRKPDVRDARS
jgi:multicomponent Na+:H+ antiporter subunit G